MGWVVNVTPRPLYPRRRGPLLITEVAGWTPGLVWTGAEQLASTGIRSSDRPASRKSQYRLSYRYSSCFFVVVVVVIVVAERMTMMMVVMMTVMATEGRTRKSRTACVTCPEDSRLWGRVCRSVLSTESS